MIRARRYLTELIADLPGIVLAAVLALALPLAVFAALLEWVNLP